MFSVLIRAPCQTMAFIYKGDSQHPNIDIKFRIFLIFVKKVLAIAPLCPRRAIFHLSISLAGRRFLMAVAAAPETGSEFSKANHLSADTDGDEVSGQ